MSRAVRQALLDYQNEWPPEKRFENCPFQGCCEVCIENFPGWAKKFAMWEEDGEIIWMERRGKVPPDGCPCEVLNKQYIKQKMRSIIKDRYETGP